MLSKHILDLKKPETPQVIYVQKKRSFWKESLKVFIAIIISTVAVWGISHADAPTYTWTEQKDITQQLSWSSIVSSSDGMKIAAVSGRNGVSGYILTSNDGGSTWTERISVGKRNWSSITSSADGTKLSAVVGYSDDYANISGSIYTSNDSGATWVEQTSAGTRNWTSITSSSDGTKLAAATYGGYIYTSTDSGTTWTQQINSGQQKWTSITSSSDGTKLAAVEISVGTFNRGYVHTSNNSGSTWAQQSNPSQQTWNFITSSSDGTKLVATDSNYIFTSSDSGVTWTQRTNAGFRNWISIAVSTDGTKITALAYYNGPGIYTSNDGGTTWATTSAGSFYWNSLTASSDGNRIIAVESDVGRIHISTDSGVSWNIIQGGSNVGRRAWRTIVSSSDGTKLAIIDESYKGKVYTSVNGGTTWISQLNGLTYPIGLTMSSDGTKLAALSREDYIYTSSDSGITWTEQTAIGQHVWYSLSASQNGMKLAAVADGDEDNGYVYTSSDGGVSWTEHQHYSFKGTVAYSGDGSKIVIVDLTDVSGAISTSNNDGVTWTEQTDAGQRDWDAVATSFDGSKIIAADVNHGNGGYLYTSSDGGITWTTQTNVGSRKWSAVASSEDGTTFVASEGSNRYDNTNNPDTGSIYLSSNSGQTWTQQTQAGEKSWRALALSSNGLKLAAASIGDYIQTGVAPEPVAVTPAKAPVIIAPQTSAGGYVGPYIPSVNNSNAPIGTTTATSTVSTTISTSNLVGCQPGYMFNTFTGVACPASSMTSTTSVSTSSAPTSQNFLFTKNLQVGSNNSEVKLLQQFLNYQGYTIANSGAGSNGSETTYFGQATKAALIKFQKANTINPASGYFGPLTRAFINNIKY